MNPPDECDHLIEDAAALIDGHVCINFSLRMMIVFTEIIGFIYENTKFFQCQSPLNHLLCIIFLSPMLLTSVFLPPPRISRSLCGSCKWTTSKAVLHIPAGFPYHTMLLPLPVPRTPHNAPLSDRPHIRNTGNPLHSHTKAGCETLQTPHIPGLPPWC